MDVEVCVGNGVAIADAVHVGRFGVNVCYSQSLL